MNDIRNTRRPAHRSSGPRGPKSDQLGELEFADWYETPVFEPDHDERIEEMATGGRGPKRVVARVMLAREARRAQRRPPHTKAAEIPPSARVQPVTETRRGAPGKAPAHAEAEAEAGTASQTQTSAGPSVPSSTVTRPPAPAKTAAIARDEESLRTRLDAEGWRRRVSSLLDRWARSEVAVAARLDRSLEKVLDPSLPRSLPALIASRRGGSR